MSRNIEVTIHCNACGYWVHPDAYPVAVRRKLGWICEHRQGLRGQLDICPDCVKKPVVVAALRNEWWGE